ncbi:cysteine/O-acetylserine transporter [Klebsiella pneumoniae]|nr:cysteine/O-acetylserine transporter [Klebsiella pneumoniae]
MRVLAGMSIGFIITMLICAALALSLVELDSRFTLSIGMDWRGVHPVAWPGRSPKTNRRQGRRVLEPVGFGASLGLQFVNVKIILYGITALSTFVLPVTREPVWLISVSLLLAAIGALGNLCWALAGHLFQRLFLLYGRQLNWMLAALLVYCAVRIVVE